MFTYFKCVCSFFICSHAGDTSKQWSVLTFSAPIFPCSPCFSGQINIWPFSQSNVNTFHPRNSAGSHHEYCPCSNNWIAPSLRPCPVLTTKLSPSIAQYRQEEEPRFLISISNLLTTVCPPGCLYLTSGHTEYQTMRGESPYPRQRIGFLKDPIWLGQEPPQGPSLTFPSPTLCVPTLLPGNPQCHAPFHHKHDRC